MLGVVYDIIIIAKVKVVSLPQQIERKLNVLNLTDKNIKISVGLTRP